MEVRASAELSKATVQHLRGSFGVVDYQQKYPNKKEAIMSLVGGNIAEMENVAGRFALTGEDTFARGSEVSAFARSQQAEYDNLAHSLVNHINAKAAECRS